MVMLNPPAVHHKERTGDDAHGVTATLNDTLRRRQRLDPNQLRAW
jgi:hypothetical protein